MRKSELLEKLQEFTKENSSVKVQLVTKNKKIYTFMNAQLNNPLQEEIFELISENMIKMARLNELVNFDPVSKEDYTMEILTTRDVNEYNDFVTSRTNQDNYINTIDDFNDKVGFYVTEFNNGQSNIKIFRRYSKSKSLSKGILFKCFNNILDKIEDTIFQIDESIDFICINDTNIIIFNRYSFELITGYKTNYKENLEKALIEIRSSNLINNIDQFCEDCKDSIKIAKRFTKAMANSSIELILSNLGEVEPAIREAELPIRFIENKFEYEGKENLHDLVKLLSDEYAKTLIGKRITC